MEKLNLNLESCVPVVHNLSLIGNSPLKIVHRKQASLHRSSDQWMKFLKHVYLKQNGDPLKWPESVYADWQMAVRELNLTEEQFHSMSKDEVVQQMFKFHDLVKIDLNQTSARNLSCALYKYKLFVDYTRGMYNPVRVAA
jgi:hypothetical protein